MTTLKNIFILLGAAIISNSMVAQDSIVDRNVTVEREFKPLIQDAGKINSIPQVLEPIVEKTKPNYSDFKSPLVLEYSIHTLDAAELNREKRRTPKPGFARIGLGNYTNTLMDFAYPLVKRTDTRLDFTMNHYGTFAPVKKHSTTNAALAFDKYLNTLNLYAGVGGGHEAFNYYGNRFKADGSIVNRATDTLLLNQPLLSYVEIDSLKNRAPQTLTNTDIINQTPNNTFWRFNAYAGVKSLPFATDFRYLAEVEYKTFSSIAAFTESNFKVKAKLDAEIDADRLGIDLELNNMTYKPALAINKDLLDAYSILTLNPYYAIERDAYKVRIGMKTTFSIADTTFFPSPDVSGELFVVPEVFALYGGFTGFYQQNSMDKTFAENPYLYSLVRLQNTYTPYSFFFGLKVKPIYNLLIDLYVDYREIENQYFFVNKAYSYTGPTAVASADSILYSNKFNVIYKDASLFKAGLRANYNIRNVVNFELKGAYNGWSVTNEDYAWNKPKWEASFSSNIRLNRNLNFSANLFYEGERYAKLIKSELIAGYSSIGQNKAVAMEPKIDLNLGMSYNYRTWLAVFLKANNLLNNKDQDFYGYESQGLNVLVGASFSF